jgi:hypothetical protein
MRRASRMLDEDGRAGPGVEPRRGGWLLRRPRWNSRRQTRWFLHCARRDRRCCAGVPIGESNSESVIGAPKHVAFANASMTSNAQHEFPGECVRSHPGNSCTTAGRAARPTGQSTNHRGFNPRPAHVSITGFISSEASFGGKWLELLTGPCLPLSIRLFNTPPDPRRVLLCAPHRPQSRKHQFCAGK